MKKSATDTMLNVMNLRNSRKSYVVYAVALFVLCSVGLVMKNFNDKLIVMTDTVHSYEKMVDKQSNEINEVSEEKERVKRELSEEKEVNLDNMRDLRKTLEEMEKKFREASTKHSSELSDLYAQHRKLENKYQTLSKANGAAIAEIETLKTDNKILRSHLHDAATSKASELLQLRDSMAKISLERDKYKDQYSALFKQHQQSYDSIQVLKNEKDRLQEQIREIQRLSGSVGGSKQENSSPPTANRQAKPDANRSSKDGSSTVRALVIPQVMDEPGQQKLSSSTSSAAPANASPAAAQAPPPYQAGLGAAPQAPPANYMQAVDKAAQLARYPPAKQPVRQVAKQVFPAAIQQPMGQRYYQGSPQGRQQEYYHPAQLVQRHPLHPENNEIDVLRAPIVKQQQPYIPQGKAPWYPGLEAGQYAAPQMVKQVPYQNNMGWQQQNWEDEQNNEEEEDDEEPEESNVDNGDNYNGRGRDF